MPSLLRDLWDLRNILVVILAPILLLPLPLVVATSEAQCGYVILVIAVYWLTEALPIAVTSLLPIVLFPVVGVLPPKAVSSVYINDTSMLFMGGLIVAAAIEHWNIHRRIALRILLIAGTEPKWLMFGLMFPTWFLSLWISNTASTAMMIPIANAVLTQLKDTTETKEDNKALTKLTQDDNEMVLEVTVIDNIKGSPTEPQNMENGNIDNKDEIVIDYDKKIHKEQTKESAEYTRMCRALSLCIAYAANVGGIGSLTGTLPNVVLKGQADIVFQEHGGESPVTFTTWMVFGMPLSLLVVIIIWIWLQLYFLRFKGCFSCLRREKNVNERVKEAIRKEYDALGPVSFAQGAVMVHFALMALLWITRDLGGIGGWSNLFLEKHTSDSLPSTLIACILFIFPSAIKRGKYGKLQLDPLLSWKVAQEKVPWGVFLLLGGGFALAKGSQTSGLSSLIGNQFASLGHLEPWILNMVLCYIIACVTEVTSNTATCTLIMPIMASLALSLQVNPLYFMFPAALACSFAFMLPAATPPNAVVFSYGNIRVIDMVSAGFFINVMAVPVLVLATETWGNAYFNFHTLPEIFKNNVNITTTAGLTSVVPYHITHLLNTTGW